MKLSEKAWKTSSKVIEAIKRHPFNQALKNGSLPLNKFAYYIEQDTLYLRDFARCHAIIASKIQLEYVRPFLRYSDYTFVAEQEVVHHFFRKTFNFQETGLFTPATLSYTSYLLQVCSIEPVEVAVAAILPCFWVYREVGLDIAKGAAHHNPFARWIETYAGDDFGSSVNEAIDIFDALSTKTTAAIKSKMLDAFYKSTCLEWHFWNDAYNEVVFDNVLSATVQS
jgi:thiaminase/transcriptional activator TenA